MFAEDNLVYVHLRKERLSRGTYDKMKFKKISMCKILWKISNNAYVLGFPKCMGISPTFKVFNLSKFEQQSKSDERDITNLLT